MKSKQKKLHSKFLFTSRRQREREGRERMASPVEMATSTTTRRGVEF